MLRGPNDENLCVTAVMALCQRRGGVRILERVTYPGKRRILLEEVENNRPRLAVPAAQGGSTNVNSGASVGQQEN